MNTVSLRITVSPLHELIGALRLLLGSGSARSARYVRWARHAAPVLARLGRLRIYAAPGLPAVLTPVPRSATPGITEELAALRAYTEDPLLADALAAFWDAAVAPHWPALRTALELDVQTRSRTLAAEGPEAVLASLRLTASPHRRVLLAPTTFEPGPPVLDGDVLLLTYRCSVTPALDPAPRPDRLTPLVGPARARLLRALEPPATTTALAASLGYAPSSVSAQLAVLVDCGLATRRRAGQRVLYTLAPTGRALLSWLE